MVFTSWGDLAQLYQPFLIREQLIYKHSVWRQKSVPRVTRCFTPSHIANEKRMVSRDYCNAWMPERGTLTYWWSILWVPVLPPHPYTRHNNYTYHTVRTVEAHRQTCISHQTLMIKNIIMCNTDWFYMYTTNNYSSSEKISYPIIPWIEVSSPELSVEESTTRSSQDHTGWLGLLTQNWADRTMSLSNNEFVEK